MIGGWHGPPGSIWKEAGTTCSIAVSNGILSSKARNVTGISLSCYRNCRYVWGVQIHGYVLMANHYHLQIETLQGNLSQSDPVAQCLLRVSSTYVISQLAKGWNQLHSQNREASSQTHHEDQFPRSANKRRLMIWKYVRVVADN